MFQALRKWSLAGVAAATLTGGAVVTVDMAQAQFFYPGYYRPYYRPYGYYRPHYYGYGYRGYGYRRYGYYRRGYRFY